MTVLEGLRGGDLLGLRFGKGATRGRRASIRRHATQALQGAPT